MCPGRVGEDQGGNGEHQEDASGGGLDVQEVGERLGQPVGRYLRQFDVFSIGLPVSTHEGTSVGGSGRRLGRQDGLEVASIGLPVAISVRHRT
ncbi:hypothetical protein D3C78_915590 [compost metagenome]